MKKQTLKERPFCSLWNSKRYLECICS